ncbi:protein LDOC1-like [Ambystoma mexicanum]|uniref:protein LDOC1-like n=1 Tax=Ambystoma mexicanum TaxID=8296 RepID=UPI0037E9B3F1
MATPEQLQEMVAAVQNLSAEVRNVSMEVKTLRTENNMLKQLVSNRGPKPVDLPPMALPSGKYDGASKKLKEFLDDCSIHFAFRPHTFPTGHIQVGFMISNMSDNALAWATPLVLGTDPILQDYEAFVGRLKQEFERPEISFSAGKDLLDIRQGQSDVHTGLTMFTCSNA